MAECYNSIRKTVVRTLRKAATPQPAAPFDVRLGYSTLRRIAMATVPKPRIRRIRVCILERHDIAKEHLRLILSRDSAFRIIEINEEQLRTLRRPIPEVFLLSHFHHSVALNLVKLIRHSSKTAKILLIGDAVRSVILFSMIRSGAHGFLSDRDVDGDLCKAVIAVGEGLVWIRSKYLTHDAKVHSFAQSNLRAPQKFTPQQSRVIDLVRDRLANKEIAATMGISERTVKFHLQNVFRSMGINSRSDIQAAMPSTVMSGRTD
jgi:DNA-binding NarL/FixJ family response regulator